MSKADQSRSTGRLPLHRFSAFADLADREVQALEGLADTPIMSSRGLILRREGDIQPGLFLLHKGWAASFCATPDKGRQYLKIHCAGDMIGAPSLPMARAADTIIALTDVVVSALPARRLFELFVAYPRLAMLFFLTAQQERIFLMDHIASLGRRTAEQRVAAFLVHIAERVQQAEPQMSAEFELPLTQTQIGDVLGLTPVHVNRVLRSFDLSGHIRRYRRWIALLRAEDLRKLAGLPSREIARNPSWLPAI